MAGGGAKGVRDMAGRFLALLAGLFGAFVGSQAPGFTLQYMQNLTGRIDELRPIVERFDADVGRFGYSREAALSECALAAGLLEALCGGYATTVRRYEILTAHRAALEAASEYVRPLVLIRAAGAHGVVREIAGSVIEVYKPAIPATLDGAAYTGGGFAIAWGGLSFLFGFLGAIFGRRRCYD